ncbi:MAG: dihydrofolate reductase [Prevotellaceae bacterium]|nr:dipeptidyl peptidase 3 [Prevotella sp.]MDD7606826.1 dihydrofolate reductase [Prevotellaceae bacterium]
MQDVFRYTDERFADIQMLRYRLNGFDKLSTQQKLYIYYLSQATLAGRDITFDQFGRYNLRIRKLLEEVYCNYRGDRQSADFLAMEVYLKRVWFSSGIYHHYGTEKFVPGFTREFLEQATATLPDTFFVTGPAEDAQAARRELFDVIFDPTVLPKRVNQADGVDLVQTSACNFYEGVTQREVEDYYARLRADATDEAPSFGLNSKLVKTGGQIRELTYTASGLYAPAIRQIVMWLNRAAEVTENVEQRRVIALLVDYYTTGHLPTFDQYSIEWLKEQRGQIDFINGFIEVYGDPLGLKGSWEGIVEYKDMEATRRTRTISDNAQWFEDHSPVDARFRKQRVTGVTAHVVCAAMLGGDEYPATAIGINLPNAEWIRARYGSKSVTIANITEAYNKVAHGNGFLDEFVIDHDTSQLIDRYGDVCDDLHTDLHECLGHGSGQLLPGVSPDALKAYGSTIEEARADLFGLYYLADAKLVELGLVPDSEAYKAQYYTYIMNGAMTQLVRIEPGHNIEEAHMRNRALIAHWVLEHAADNVQIVQRDGKSYLSISDYASLRGWFGQLLREIQRIKSEGDFEAARALVERYAVTVDSTLHAEVLARYKQLDIAPYKGFINPVLQPVYGSDGQVADVKVDYTEGYAQQMLRYSKEFGWL